MLRSSAAVMESSIPHKYWLDLLFEKIGGPSVLPPQLPNITKEGT